MDPAIASRPAAASAAAAKPSYKWQVVAMLWFVCFFNYADRQSIFSVFPKLRDEFGFSTPQLGLVGSAFMWVYAAGAPFAGYICDRFRRKDLILGGCVFWSFVTMVTGWCRSLWQFVFVRALEGLGETFYFPASMSLTSDYHAPKTRSRALSLHQSSVYVGTIAGGWLGAWFAEKYGWRWGFYFFGGMGIVLAVVLYRFLREPLRGGAEENGARPVQPRRSKTVPLGGKASNANGLEHAAGGAAPLHSQPELPGTEPPLSTAETLNMIFRAPAILLLMLAFVAANFVATIFLTWTPTFLVEKFHFRLTAAGLSGSVFIHLASAASVPLAGWMADVLARRFAGGRIAVQALGLMIGAGFVVLVGVTASTGVLLFAMTAFGFCKGFYDSGIFASLFDMIEPRARGTAAGIMNTVGWGGGAMGPLFVGLASKYGGKPTEIENMSSAISFGGPIYLIGAAALVTAFFLARRSRMSG